LLPTVLRDWWGFFIPGGLVPEAVIVVDYQNIHLTGHGLWCPEGDGPHHCLVHPLHYANQVLQQRNLIRRLVAERDGNSFEEATLAKVLTFRGLPSNEQDPVAYRRSMAQKSEWTRDPRSEVVYRPLKYYKKQGGRTEVKEKGIDVLVALELVKCAASRGDSDVIILAAHDTDQEPALQLAHQLAGERIETTGWMNSKRLRVPGAQVWHTQLEEDAFIRSRDRKDYS
jgi:uncharacterized LabA/DUF88 family protein